MHVGDEFHGAIVLAVPTSRIDRDGPSILHGIAKEDRPKGIEDCEDADKNQHCVQCPFVPFVAYDTKKGKGERDLDHCAADPVKELAEEKILIGSAVHQTDEHGRRLTLRPRTAIEGDSI